MTLDHSGQYASNAILHFVLEFLYFILCEKDRLAVLILVEALVKHELIFYLW